MNLNSNAVLATAAVGVVAVAIAKSVKTNRIEREKRRQIEINKNIDLAAIRTAEAMVKMRTAMRQYNSPLEALQDFYEEVKFQEIVARY